MDTKHIHCMLEDMAEYGKCMIEKGAGSENVNLDCAGKVVDMVKDLAEAEYYALIAKEMRKSGTEEEEADKHFLKMLKEQYGEEEGRKYYDDYRYSSGRFAPRGRGRYMPRRGYTEPPYYHQMPMTGARYDEPERMYYTGQVGGMMGSRTADNYTAGVGTGTGMSRYGYSHDEYMDHMKNDKADTPEDKKKRHEVFKKRVEEIAEMLAEEMDELSTEEKQMWRGKLNKLINA